ncbi:hypothetical protein VIBNI_B0559 [Vibrio nigripulchritudo]|uniref:Uncharacterized protein n=2 Tax=Vibrio nigripulchritudo TaxID=28173 RepID=U4KBT4_9VIBR|nr:hypothetical protein VIBNI_B0559 [Vibrio nigripulchritudo]
MSFVRDFVNGGVYMVGSEKIFNTYIKEYMFQPNDRLFNSEKSKYIKGFQVINESSIYAIVKVPKANFIPGSFYVTKNYCAVGNIDVAGKVHEVMFNIAKYWFEGESDLSEKLHNDFGTIEKFIEAGMSRYTHKQFSNVSNQDKFMHLAEVDVEQSSIKNLYIKCPIATALNNGNKVYADIPIYQMIQKFDMECIDEVEICYIGKSTASTFSRLQKHEKWGPILSSEGDDNKYDFLAYFFVIDEAAIYRGNLGGVNLIYRDFSELPKGAITSLCEASLINYFKPEFNIEFTSSDLNNSKLFSKWLRKNGYTSVITEVELDGVLGKLSTKERPYQVRHVCDIEINP